MPLSCSDWRLASGGQVRVHGAERREARPVDRPDELVGALRPCARHARRRGTSRGRSRRVHGAAQPVQGAVVHRRRGWPAGPRAPSAAMWSGQTWQCASMIMRLRPAVPLDQLPGQRVEDDLGRPLVDPHRPRLPVEPLDHAAADQAETAHHLHRTVHDPAGHLGRADLRHRRQVQVGAAGRGPPRRPPGRSASAPSRSRSRTARACDGHRAEPGERHAELLRAGGVPERLVEGGLRDADGRPGHRHPEGGEGREHEANPWPGSPDPVVGGHPRRRRTRRRRARAGR